MNQYTAQGAVLTELILEIFRLNGQLLAQGDQLTAELRLTSARWQVLGALALENRALTVAQIARRMGLKRQSVQRLVDILVTQEILVLRENPDHKRAKRVELTPVGKEIYQQIEQVQITWANKLAQGIGTEELNNTLEVLRQLRGRLECVCG